MRIQIFGAGCAGSLQSRTGLPTGKGRASKNIMQFGAMATPAFAIVGTMRFHRLGGHPAEIEIQLILTESINL